MTSPEQAACPKCGSTDIHFRKKRGDWVCDDCEHKFEVEAWLAKPNACSGSRARRAWARRRHAGPLAY